MNNNIFYGWTLQASNILRTNRIDSISKNNNTINIGGCATQIVINGSLQVSEGLCADCLNTTEGSVNVSGGGLPNAGQVLIATGPNSAEWGNSGTQSLCAACLQTNDNNINVDVSQSDPPSDGDVLIATSDNTATWQPLPSGSGNGNVSCNGTGQDNEIPRFTGTNCNIKNDTTEPTTLDNNGFFDGPTIATGGNNSNLRLGLNTGQNGSNNIFIGRNVGNSNTGIQNTFLGNESGLSNTTGNRNTFLGKDSGQSNTTGVENTFLGKGSGRKNTSGDNNTFLGKQSGFNNTTGEHNVYIGNNAGGDSNNTSSSDRLIIENTSENDNPLIDGTFATNNNKTNGTLKFNAKVTIGNDQTQIHEINGQTSNPPTTSLAGYLDVKINGTNYHIPYYNS